MTKVPLGGTWSSRGKFFSYLIWVSIDLSTKNTSGNNVKPLGKLKNIRFLFAPDITDFLASPGSMKDCLIPKSPSI